MYAETKPILFNCPKEFDTVEIYPVHDLHYGSEQFRMVQYCGTVCCWFLFYGQVGNNYGSVIFNKRD